MTPTRPIVFAAMAAAGFGAAAAGCNLLLGSGYVVGAQDASATTDGPGADSTPAEVGTGDVVGAQDASATTDSRGPDSTPGDGGCATDPQDKLQFESACTNSTCEPFDNATRNTLCEGGTACPKLAGPEGGTAETGPPEASAPEAGNSEAGAADAASAIDAGISCFGLTQGPAGGKLPSPIVYATGSTAIQPYMGRVAQVLESLGIGSVVYQGAGSCFGVSAMVSPGTTPLASIASTATYYDSELDSSGALQSGTCVIDDPAAIADLGISDVFATTCEPQLLSQGLPNNLHDFFGPVQTMEMVVPASSSQTSISSEAAYMVWGFGSNSGVAPWTHAAFLLQRSASSGTQNMIAQTIGLPASEWAGTPNATSGAVLTAIENVDEGENTDGGPAPSSYAEGTIGILASDVADPNRMYLKPLAFQDVGQACGWYPDSTQAAFDKNNVRDGHYPIWGPSHLIAYADADGNAKTPAVATLIGAMNGQNAQVLATLDIIQFYAQSHIIPTCAMHVQRAQDGHDYQPYAPPVSCSCYYDYQATGQTSCTSCKVDADCANAPNGATTCVTNFGNPPVGFCEPPGP